MKLRNRLFSHRSVSGISVAWGVALGLLLAGSAQATLVNLSFSGTYNLNATVFGVSGPTVAFNYQITYDTALDTNAMFFPAGASLGGLTTTHDWYGYSASGITATNVTFGSQTWTAGDVNARDVAAGISADLWFDTDIGISTPTRSWIFFIGGSPGLGALELGTGVGNGVNIFIEGGHSFVTDMDSSGDGETFSMTIGRTAVGVPEPATLALLGLGLTGLGFTRRRTSH